ncbi:MAG: GNAT family N-acetyltransferase [Halobacteriovorax sp.]|nr:GNAT family N-acetyltransferase [Halobacteriovorax sp.]
MQYTSEFEQTENLDINGFFVGWPNPPSNQVFEKLLKSSYKVVLACEGDKLVGFITAISDGVLSAYIPFLEVLPAYQNRGIGAELLAKMKQELSHLYMVDLLCDQDLVGYYQKQGMSAATGAMLRNYQHQSGQAQSASSK